MKTYKIIAYDSAGNELTDKKLTEQPDLKSAKKFAYDYIMNISTCSLVSSIAVTDTETNDTETIIIY